jgi:hypothetical protein
MNSALCALAGGLALWSAPAQAAAEPCPNAASRQGPSIGLPDCRVYEQVTPVNKGAAIDLFPTNPFFQFYETRDTGVASEDGNHFLLYTLASFGANGESGYNTYVFSRGAGGWGTTGISSEGLGVQSVAPWVFDPVDLSAVGVEDTVGSTANLAGGNASADQYVRLAGPVGGPYATVNASPRISPEQAAVVGASTDLSHIVLESTNHLLAPGDGGQDEGSHALYEWAGRQLGLVNVNTDGSLVSACGAILGLGNEGYGHNAPEGGTRGAVSDDGSKIFFTAPDPEATGPGCWEGGASPPELYMRVSGARTIEISAPNLGVNDPNGMQPAAYVGASADGSRVFFITRTELTADDTTHDPELYEYDTNRGILKRVSRGVSGTADGNVDFVPAVSSDGSTVYFTAYGQLAPGASALPPGNGLVNLYRYDTVTETTTYITDVGYYDYPMAASELSSQWYITALQRPTDVYAEELGLDARADWYTTGDGRYLVFDSYQRLTGYDNTAAPGAKCENLLSGMPEPEDCAEVFRYDAAAGSIVCVSCGSPGVHPVEGAMFARTWLHSPAGVSPRPVSEDGSYVFFDTNNELVPQATNGVVNVYEWHNGTISLISPPGASGNSFFLGSSAEGKDVFFGTHAQLAPSDTDYAGDVYDARIGGGFLGQAAPACTGTGCQGVPAPAPLFAVPASTTFEGAGNLAPPPPSVAKPKSKPKGCGVGLVKKGAKCVRKAKSVKKKAKRPARGRK